MEAAAVINAGVREIGPGVTPNLGDWMVCENGHIIAQYVDKDRTRLADWGHFLGGATTEASRGRKRITCGICGAVALDQKAGQFACRVVSNDVVKQAVNAVVAVVRSRLPAGLERGENRN
jgi:hypothetical protein